jgi:hypothetical protein
MGILTWRSSSYSSRFTVLISRFGSSGSLISLLDILNSASTANLGQFMVMTHSRLTTDFSTSRNGMRFETRTSSPLTQVFPRWIMG